MGQLFIFLYDEEWELIISILEKKGEQEKEIMNKIIRQTGLRTWVI